MVELHSLGCHGKDLIGKQPVIGPGLLQMLRQFGPRGGGFHILPHRPALGRHIAEPADRHRQAVFQMVIAVGAAVKVLQSRMGKGHMIAFVIYVADRLPVDRQVGGPVGHRDGKQGFQIIGREIGIKRGQQSGDVGLGAGAEPQEDEAVKALHFDRFQPERLAVQCAERLGLRGPAQRAVKVVDPAMKRADHRPLATAMCPVHHPRAPVTAQVVKRPHHAVLSPHHNRAFAQQIIGHPVAGVGHIAFMADHLPMGHEQLFPLQREHRGGMVGPCGKAAAVPVIGDGDNRIRKFGHGASSISARIHCWNR